MEEEREEAVLEERWLPIPDYEGWYEASDFGRIRNVRDRMNTFVGKILKQSISSFGYMRVGLSKKGVTTNHLVHRLVMAAFVGQCPDGKEVNHKDCDKTNNIPDNLEYVTSSENQLHAFTFGRRSNQGENNPFSKLIEENVREIKKALGKEPQKSIAVRFNVSRRTIGYIANGKAWTHVK